MRLSEIQSFMMRPVSIAGLVWFRVAFGFIMIWEVFRYFIFGWVTHKFVNPPFHFKFYGFDWLPDIPGPLFYLVWALIGISAFGVMAGHLYRLSIITLTILFSYIFLIEQANYLNHFYFVCLMSFAMCFLHPHLAFSWDAQERRVEPSSVIPFWQHFMICFLMGVVYFYGGIAKIDPDWLTGVPLNLWLDVHEHIPLVGPFLKSDLTALVFSYMGAALDLFIVPLLIWKRTRVFAFAVITAFHVTNHFIFQIGIFPWFSIATTLLFFGPDFPLKVIRYFKQDHVSPFRELPANPPAKNNWVLGAIVMFCLFNIIMPLRHHLQPGDVHWHERGHTFSWRMKLRTKTSDKPVFIIRDMITGKKWREDPVKRLSQRQAQKMSRRPEMILTYVKYLKKVLAREGHPKVEIRMMSLVSLNGRRGAPLINPDVNLADVEDCVFCDFEWIAKPRFERTWSDSYEKLMKRL